MEEITLFVEKENNQMRIDKYLCEVLPEYSRSYLQKLCKESCVTVNKKEVKANYKVSEGDTVLLTLPEPKSLDISPEDIPLDILYEDEDVLLVNKPKGMVVHPSAGHTSGTLVNALLYHCKDNLSTINGVLRPGIVHRIDMDTTGVLIVCKNDYSHQFISEQLKEHTITRKYHLIVYDNLKEDEGTITGPIGRHPRERKKMAIVPNGKNAVTHYKVLERFSNYTYVECQLETGRTHQIRVHMASIHHPLLGDTVYGPQKKSQFSLQGQTLHAMVLGFIHPTTKEYMEFSSPLPKYFQEILSKLRNGI
ncbi:MAG: RluA family pseudouridine synthase [Lachnospiraceae bacterium]|nr:RluA family pseudouridine synthase [Lachnospiraceae bacterium]MEE1341722.1 RluA family pseudouridine synthase [Lachnospiraceae bacterium]